MYKRDNQPEAQPPQKADEHKRARNVILNFRVTVEEKKKIERRMALSGMDKQDFLIQSLMRQKVLCLGNVKTFDEMKKQLFEIKESLNTVNTSDQLDEENLESLRMILELYNGLNKVTDEDVYVPVRKSKGRKKNAIKFSERAHEDFYYRKTYEYDRKAGNVDGNSHAFFYLMGLCKEIRENFSSVFSMEEKSTVIDGLFQDWQTESTRKICRLAFNLWNGFCYKNADDKNEKMVDELYAVDEIFNCEYAEYFFQAIQLKYPALFKV